MRGERPLTGNLQNSPTQESNLTNGIQRLTKSERQTRLDSAKNELADHIRAPASRTQALAERLQTPPPTLRQAQTIIKSGIENRQERAAQGIKAQPETQKKYEKLAAQMFREGKKPEEIAATKASYFSYRAAVVNDAINVGKQAKIDLASASKQERTLKGQVKQNATLLVREQLLDASIRKAEAKSRLTAAAQVLSRYQPGETNRAANIGRPGYQQLYKVDPERAKSTSMKSAESMLPRGWQDRIFDAARREDRPAVAVLSISGARPAEIQKGVKIERLENGGLKLTIRGAKADEFRGSKSRELELKPEQVQENKQASYLHKIAGDRGGTTVKTKDSENLSRRLSEVGQKNGMNVSGYSFRHAFASDARAAGKEEKEIGAAMGHRSAVSTRSYGKR